MNKILLSAVALTFPPSQARRPTRKRRAMGSGTGDDMFPCSRTAPCKTFAVAMAATRRCADQLPRLRWFGSCEHYEADHHRLYRCDRRNRQRGRTGVTINIAGGAVTLRCGSRWRHRDRRGQDHRCVEGQPGERGSLRQHPAGRARPADIGWHDPRDENSTIRNNTLAGISTTATSASGVILDKVISKQNQYGVAVANGQTTMIRETMSRTIGRGNRSGCYRRDRHHRQHDGLQRNGRLISGTATMANNSVVNNTTGLGGGGTITSSATTALLQMGRRGRRWWRLEPPAPTLDRNKPDAVDRSCVNAASDLRAPHSFALNGCTDADKQTPQISYFFGLH